MLERLKTNTSRRRKSYCNRQSTGYNAQNPRAFRFDNLIMRFEEPSSMARWDSPLFAISWDDDLEGTNKSILDDLWVAVTQGAKKGPTAAVVTVSFHGEHVVIPSDINIRRASSLPQMRYRL